MKVRGVADGGGWVAGVMTLFDPNVTRSLAPQGEHESLFEYLQRLDHPQAGAARQWIEAHGGPFIGDARWVACFRSKRQDQCLSAFFELYGYELFRCLGCTVLEIEPSHGGGSPDLRLRSPSGIEFLVEMACVLESQEADRQMGEVNRLWTILSDVAHGYKLKLVPTEKFPRLSALPIKKIASQLERWLSSPTPLRHGNTCSYKDPTTNEDLFYIEVSTDGRPGPWFDFRQTHAGKKIRNTLRKKSRQFQAEGVPVVVLLNSVAWTAYPMWDLKEALCGSLTLSVPVPLTLEAPSEPVRRVHAGHSAAWVGDGGPAGTSQSAVVVCGNIGPFNFGGGEGHAVVHDHPWAKSPLDTSFICFTRCLLHKDSGVVEEVAGTRTLHDLFK